MLARPTKQLKQIFQIEHNIIPTDRRQTSWLFTSVAEDLKSGLPRNKSMQRHWSERDSNWGPPDCESDTLTTRPRCLSCSKSFLVHIMCSYQGYVNKNSSLIAMFGILLWLYGPEKFRGFRETGLRGLYRPFSTLVYPRRMWYLRWLDRIFE